MIKKLKKAIRNLLENLGINSGIRNQIIDHNPFKRQTLLLKNKKPIIFDIGAHDGRTLRTYKKYWEDCFIYSFEASSKNFSTLERKCKDLNKVKLENYAISNNIGQIDFNINKSSFTNSILPTSDINDERLRLVNRESVNSITLDKYCSDNSIDKIDILKIDVQGAELMVLEGACELLSKGKIELVYLEVCFKNQYLGQASFGDILILMTSYDFSLVNLYDISYSKDREICYADAIFHHIQN